MLQNPAFHTLLNNIILYYKSPLPVPTITVSGHCHPRS